MAGLKDLGNWFREKLNPAQEAISRDEGSYIGSTAVYTHIQAYEKIETVNRSVNMLVQAAASLDYDILDKVHDGAKPGMRLKQLNTLLNYRPNPYQSAYDFRLNVFTDLVLDGNAFIYFDGTFMYHLPASQVEILTDTKTFISGFKYNGSVTFGPDEVFYFKDPSNTSIYRGTSRLKSAAKSIALVQKMQEFQENFFDNGAVFGTVLVTDNTLGTSAKERTISYWVQKYNTKAGGRRPVILDSGLKPVQLAEQNFKDMDFDQSLKTHSERIMQALGVPPLLLAGGNNANIAPNLKLFYLETVLPVTRAFTSALERYFGYDIDVITNSVSALQPELKDIAAYHSTLVNGGVLTPNEAREALRYAKLTGHDDLRVPANIAGSAANPSQGGAPKKDETE
jgi:HK97 family phage portal protein